MTEPISITPNPPPPAPPADLGQSGADLWNALCEDVEFGEEELRVLHEAGRISDRLDALAEYMKTAPLFITERGRLQGHPAVVEQRLQQALLVRVLGSIKVPPAEDEPKPERQRATYNRRDMARYGRKAGAN